MGIVLPLFKKRDAKECSNYRGITLTTLPGKVFTRVIENTLRERLEDTVGESQHGFRKGKSRQDLIFTIRQQETVE